MSLCPTNLNRKAYKHSVLFRPQSDEPQGMAHDWPFSLYLCIANVIGEPVPPFEIDYKAALHDEGPPFEDFNPYTGYPYPIILRGSTTCP